MTKISFTPDEFNTLINGFIWKYSAHVGLSANETLKHMETFNKKFIQETKEHEESIQLGQDDQTTKELI